MNEIINWLATNSILMTRIGFTAVALLSVVYIFRYFFVPKISQVPAAEASTLNGTLSTVGTNLDELADLQKEIDLLKEKLKKVEVEKAELIAKYQNSGPNAEAQAEVSSSVGADGSTQVIIKEKIIEVPDAKQQAIDNINIEKAALVRKIEMLEARLAEYEIIAEDIAEVGQLKQENTELKTKIAALTNAGAGAAAVVEKTPVKENSAAESTESATTEVEITTNEPNLEPEMSEEEKELTRLAEEKLNAASAETSLAEAAEAGSSGSVQAAPTDLVITSDLEVTEAEKQILDSFENFQKQKKAAKQ